MAHAGGDQRGDQRSGRAAYHVHQSVGREQVGNQAAYEEAGGSGWEQERQYTQRFGKAELYRPVSQAEDGAGVGQ